MLFSPLPYVFFRPRDSSTTTRCADPLSPPPRNVCAGPFPARLSTSSLASYSHTRCFHCAIRALRLPGAVLQMNQVFPFQPVHCLPKRGHFCPNRNTHNLRFSSLRRAFAATGVEGRATVSPPASQLTGANLAPNGLLNIFIAPGSAFHSYLRFPPAERTAARAGKIVARSRFHRHGGDPHTIKNTRMKRQ